MANVRERQSAAAEQPDGGSVGLSETSERRASRPSWGYTFKNAFGEFGDDQCTDLAAALTYYAVLSIFPALLALVSLLGVFGQGESTTNAMLDIVRKLGQGDAANQLRGPISQMTQTHSAGFALIAGILLALWSASGYVGAFGRALNRIYQVEEGRPVWKLRPVQLAITVVAVLMAAVVLVGLVVTGPIARSIGDAVGLGTTALTVWNLAKWPVMLVVVVGLVTLLYHATPNVRHPRLRVLSIGAVIAILTWLLASAAFGLYVAHFASYNKTYGSLAGVIVFLLWLWITNLALLFGAEVDAERERSQELQAGMPAEEQLQLPPRDTRAVEKRQHKRVQRIRAGRRLRLRRQPGREPGLEHELEHELETEPRATRAGEES